MSDYSVDWASATHPGVSTENRAIPTDNGHQVFCNKPSEMLLRSLSQQQARIWTAHLQVVSHRYRPRLLQQGRTTWTGLRRQRHIQVPSLFNPSYRSRPTLQAFWRGPTVTCRHLNLEVTNHRALFFSLRMGHILERIACSLRTTAELLTPPTTVICPVCSTH